MVQSKRIGTALSIIAALSLCGAAGAEDETTAPAQPKAQSKSNASGCSMPQRLASFAVGTVVGTPIAVVRSISIHIVKETKECYKTGGLIPPFGWATAVMFGVPSGIACGIGYGIGDGFVDSYQNAKDAPFSKASFSLEKLEW